ncbi:flavodoxin [Nocardia noduli]|uniref:flavodoxin n=1 Tax=Nocardia noduli TaxID=2815722 RepID=UPI0027DFE2DD|nr:flavodoxin [Nocardia noduli]
MDSDTGCSTTESTPTSSAVPGQPGGGRILVAYFSRPGENYHYGGRRNLDIGNTEVLTGMIRDRVTADVHRIIPAAPYPAAYEATVARNRTEQESGTLPALATLRPDTTGYDTVLLGSPVWNSRAPQIMSTFIDGLDFTGKTVLPFVTYAVSGMSGIDDFYRRRLPTATVTTGLAVRGEEVNDAGGEVDRWLRENDLATR